jgi:hypothetical protein
MKKRGEEGVAARRFVDRSKPRRHRYANDIGIYQKIAAHRKAVIARQTAGAVNDSARLRHVRATTIVIFTSDEGSEGGVAYTLSFLVDRCVDAGRAKRERKVRHGATRRYPVV